MENLEQYKNNINTMLNKDYKAFITALIMIEKDYTKKEALRLTDAYLEHKTIGSIFNINDIIEYDLDYMEEVEKCEN